MAWLKGPWGQLRPGERRLTFLMLGNYFSLLLFYYLLKPARDSLFLVNLEPDQLPWVYILSALVAAPVTAAYARAGLKHRLDRLVKVTTLVLALQLVLMWWLVSIQQNWVFYLFYSWVGVAAGLTTSQFWLLSNTVFDATEAKRVFPILALGGIAGAFIGGEVTGLLVVQLGLGTRHLLLVALVVLLVSGLLSRTVWQTRSSLFSAAGEAEEDTGIQDSGGILPAIFRSRHLLLMVGIISLTVMSGSFIDFQFKAFSWQAYSDPGDLTSFLGRFYGRMSLLSFLIQAVFAARLIRWLGAGRVLFVLPLVLSMGVGAMLVVPGLMAAMLMRGSDISLKYSLDKTSRELLFLPIPLALKKRTKVFLDMFVDRWARGIAGLLLLLFTAVLGWGSQGVTLATAVLIALWLGVAFFMRKEYVNSFRLALSGREIDLKEMRLKVDDSASVEVLLSALESGNPREINYALDMMKGVAVPKLAAGVRSLLEHASPEIRQKALGILQTNGAAEDVAVAEKMLQDENLEVRLAALGLLASQKPDDFFAEMIAGPGPCRNAAVGHIIRSEDEPELQALVDQKVVESILTDVTVWGEEGRIILGSLPWLPAGCTPEIWERLLTDPQNRVQEAAVLGIGLRQDEERLPWLLARLDDPGLRVSARRALVLLVTANESLLKKLEEFLADGTQPLRARSEIPRVLSGVPTQRSVQILLRRLATHEPELRYIVLKSLGRLRARYSGLVFDETVVGEEIAVEAGRFIQLARIGTLLPEKGEAAQLLIKTIAETQQLRLESVFRLLGLLYPARDLLNAYQGVVSGRRILKANAQEFLENILSRPHGQLVQALIEDQVVEPAWLDVGVTPQEPVRNQREALIFLGSSCDPWLAACAIFVGAEIKNPAASCYLEPSGDDMLSPIEKVLILQNVDIFAEVPTDQMAALAGIAREVPVLAGADIYRENDRADALYLVLKGNVSLHQGANLVTVAGPLVSFGSWALFDEEPRVMTATAIEDSRLMRIDSSEFNDLLADDVRIAKGIIRTVSRRLRELAGKVG